MKERTVLTILALFSLGWLGWSLIHLLGAVMGDCDYGHDTLCRAAKEYVPALILWRWLAIQAVALLGCVFYLDGRKN